MDWSAIGQMIHQRELTGGGIYLAEVVDTGVSWAGAMLVHAVWNGYGDNDPDEQ